MSDQDIARRQRFRSIWIPAWIVDPFGKCTHSRQRGIYGDEILTARARARCLVCGRLLPNLPTPEQETY